MTVPYIDLGIQHQKIEAELMTEIQKVVSSGQFILGENVEKFESSFASMHDCKFAIGVANGTDALVLSIQALGLKTGDEIITCPNSYLASGSSIYLAGCTPIFCDVDEGMNMDPKSLKERVTERTKAIIPVHLTGKPANMDEIMKIAREHDLFVIEDAAQAVGASYQGKGVGSFGNLGCFSLHPLKNLSACGDAGIITTNDEKLYNHLISARNHGMKNRDECEFFSMNSRLDSLQAAILNVKIKYINQWNDRRREIAGKYNEALASYVRVPKIEGNEKAVFHTYIIRTERRDELQAYLDQNGVGNKIHYPIPIHEQEALRKLELPDGQYPNVDKQTEEILTLPVFPELTDDQVEYVVETVTSFFKS